MNFKNLPFLNYLSVGPNATLYVYKPMYVAFLGRNEVLQAHEAFLVSYGSFYGQARAL